MNLSFFVRAHVSAIATVCAVHSALLAQHPAPIAISNPALTSPERFAADVRMSPDGLFVAYSAVNGPNHSLFVRRADASTAATTVTSLVTSSIQVFPNIAFTWRHVSPASASTLLFGERTAFGGYNLREFNPGTSATTTVATFAPPTTGTTAVLELQLHPCRNVVSGAVATFFPARNRVWHLNLVAGTPIFLQSAPGLAQDLIAAEMSPDETRGIFMVHPASGGGVFEYSVAGGAPTLMTNATASPLTGGYIDNSTAYGVAASFNDLAAFGVPPSTSIVRLRRNPAVGVSEAAAAPNNLIGTGQKEFIAFINGANEVCLTPTAYGGEIRLTTPPPTFTSCFRASVDGAASRVAFIAIAPGGVRQVFVVRTIREALVTYTNNGGGTVAYNGAIPCNPNEICVLMASLGLTATPTPFGPPGSGQVDLDASAITLGFSIGAPLIFFTPQTFNASAVGLTTFFQAGRLDLATGAFMNTTRAAGVRYF